MGVSTNTRSMMLSSHTQAAQPSLVASEQQFSAHVLVVEDNAINQEVAAGLLTRLGCKTDIAENGKVAIGLLEKKTYDLILMDCQMPVLDGYETTAEIRAREQRNPAHKRATIVAMTAHALPSERDKCLSCGMDDYVSKPVTTEILKQLLATWVQPSRPVSNPSQPARPSVTAASSALIQSLPAPDLSSPVLDLERLREAGGTPAGMVRIAQLCTTQLRTRLDTIKAALDSNDFSEISRLTHMSVGSCGACGMSRMSALWRLAEAAAQSKDTAALLALLKPLEECLQDIEKAVAELPR
jgi:two-component system, sensor histidine kinase and response regulator